MNEEAEKWKQIALDWKKEATNTYRSLDRIAMNLKVLNDNLLFLGVLLLLLVAMMIFVILSK